MRQGRVVRRIGAVATRPPLQEPPASEAEPLFGTQEKQVALTLILCVGIAVALPFPPVKYALAGVLGILYWHQLMVRPDLALAIYVLALPVIDLLPATIIPVKGLNPQTLLVFSLLFRMSREPQRRQGMNPFTPGLMIFTLALVMGILTSVLEHGYPALDLLTTAKNHMIVVPVLFFAERVIVSDKQKKVVLLAMVLLLFLMSAHTIWTTRDQIAAGLLLERHRAVGLVASQANLYGGWLAMMILAAICFLFSSLVKGKTRIFLAGTIFMAAVALVYTLSRGSWIALAAALAVVAIFRNRRILLLGTAVFLFLPALVSPAVRDRAASILQVFEAVDDNPEPGTVAGLEAPPTADDSAMVRVLQWRALGGLMSQDPIFGHGYGYFPQLWFDEGHEMKAAHSSYIEIGTELGSFGLLGYLTLVLPMLYLGWRTSRKDAPVLQRTIGTAAFGMALCLMILDTSGTRFKNSEVMANFWIFAGLVSGALLPVPPVATRSRHR